MNRLFRPSIRLLHGIGLILAIALMTCGSQGHELVEECPSEVVSVELEMMASRRADVDSDIHHPRYPKRHFFSESAITPTNSRSTFNASERRRWNGLGTYLRI